MDSLSSSLMEMIEQQPGNKQQFSQISGVGQHKLDNYAEAFSVTRIRLDG